MYAPAIVPVLYPRTEVVPGWFATRSTSGPVLKLHGLSTAAADYLLRSYGPRLYP